LSVRIELGERNQLFRKTVSAIMLHLLVVSMLAIVVKVQPVSADNVDWWSMFHHDVNHIGHSTSTAPTTNNTLWTYTTGYMVWSSPAVVSGLVYVGSMDDNVYCLNAANGALVWHYKTGLGVASSPAIAGGLVYVGSYDDNVYCLNATTGALVWSYKTGNRVDNSSPAVVDGVVYVGSFDGKIYAFGGVHDVAVTNVVSSKTVIGQGFSTNINVTVANQGDYTETFNVTTYINPPSPLTIVIVINITTVSLDAGKNITISLAWDTTGLAIGNYTFSAAARPVLGETNTTDNTFSVVVKVTIPGDINGDFKVGLPDLVLLAQAYGSKPGDPNWNPNADIDGNGIVGLSDLVALAQHYGQHYP
jgi:hypothetical protein